MFGFYALASPTLPMLVTIVSVAAPRLGNIDIEFARAFVKLRVRGGYAT